MNPYKKSLKKSLRLMVKCTQRLQIPLVQRRPPQAAGHATSWIGWLFYKWIRIVYTVITIYYHIYIYI